MFQVHFWLNPPGFCIGAVHRAPCFDLQLTLERNICSLPGIAPGLMLHFSHMFLFEKAFREKMCKETEPQRSLTTFYFSPTERFSLNHWFRVDQCFAFQTRFFSPSVACQVLFVVGGPVFVFLISWFQRFLQFHLVGPWERLSDTTHDPISTWCTKASTCFQRANSSFVWRLLTS